MVGSSRVGPAPSRSAAPLGGRASLVHPCAAVAPPLKPSPQHVKAKREARFLPGPVGSDSDHGPWLESRPRAPDRRLRRAPPPGEDSEGAGVRSGWGPGRPVNPGLD